ncbi:MAG: dTDP-4-dehydrorhamnose reductase [Methanobrevibacter sp.]|jgi:dTDP-4-dehydrorhamnose reductase|nr:dTDP-4-dehydrorhamnose reductase [Methanobrevibacter sp.]
MKILLTGRNGMLGNDLIEILKGSNHEIISTNTSNLDITKLNEIHEKVDEVNPEIIINSAAYTDVDGCEIKKNLAYNVNAIGPKNLAIVANKSNCSLVHISTDYVFDGNQKSYAEEDETNPINVYGKTKLEGELFVKENLNNYFILRTAWLYGLHGSNFVKTMLNLSKNNNEIAVVNDQYGSPTFTRDLSIAISKIIETDNYGTYHITNSGNCTWYDFAKEIFKQTNIDVTLKAVTSEEFSRPAPRPKYSILNNKNWKKIGFKPLRSYKEALKEYLSLELNE